MKTFINLGGFRTRLDTIEQYHKYEDNPTLLYISLNSGKTKNINFDSKEKCDMALAQLDNILLC